MILILDSDLDGLQHEVNDFTYDLVIMGHETINWLILIRTTFWWLNPSGNYEYKNMDFYIMQVRMKADKGFLVFWIISLYFIQLKSPMTSQSGFH